jgi:hypothetical protein
MNKPIGASLIIIGMVLLMWVGFTYTQKDKTKTARGFDDTEKPASWPLYAGVFFLAGGLVIMINSKKDDAIW